MDRLSQNQAANPLIHHPAHHAGARDRDLEQKARSTEKARQTKGQNKVLLCKQCGLPTRRGTEPTPSATSVHQPASAIEEAFAGPIGWLLPGPEQPNEALGMEKVFLAVGSGSQSNHQVWDLNVED